MLVPACAEAGAAWAGFHNGTLEASFTGTRCPRGRKAHAFKITFHSVIDPEASRGIFRGATGGGPGYTTSNQNRQTFRLAWSVTLP